VDGRRDFAALEAAGQDQLAAAGFRVEYVAVRRAVNLSPPDRDSDELVVLGAGWLGKARLIDNVVVTV
jgi:pantoate--beta-alanine ligase